MTIRLHNDVAESPYKYAAIVSLDPAGVQPCGIACRATASLPAKPVLGKVRAPDFIYEGVVWNDVMIDELCAWCARNVGGQKLLLVAAGTAYGSMAIAMSIGQCIGALKLLTYYTGWADVKSLVKVQDKVWRKAAGIPEETRGRDNQKQAAIDLVAKRYQLTLGSDAAEAVLINDYAVVKGLYK